MNRIEFLAELEKLLQDISVEERKEAVAYYRDYFEDAGIENEQHIIEELESPRKVAATIKEGLKGGSGECGEYRETGFTDTRFEDKRMPAEKGYVYEDFYEKQEKKKPWSSNVLKILLILAIIIVGAPIIIPVAITVLGVVLALALSGFLILAGFVLAAIGATMVGIILIISGIMELFYSPALGIFVCGVGMILGVLGVLATVAFVKICMIVFPVLFRGIVNICRKPIHGRGTN